MVKTKLVVVILFALGGAVFLLTDNAANRPVHAFSSGPPAGYTHAPGELDCSECHLIGAAGSGRLTISAPPSYTPGQTYDITVSHSNADFTRFRWGFQLTALDAGDERAGTLEPLDIYTQVRDNQGPFPARQYVEHTSPGTFAGQQGGASWTFRWRAPLADVGTVTFYAAGNQANNDGNTSGDHIYFTFASAAFSAPAPDFNLTVSPSARSVARGAATTYDVTVTPLGGFTGPVSFAVTGLPPGASADFQPATVNLDDASPKTTTLTVSTGADTPTGPRLLNVNATGGAASHTERATLNVFGPDAADLSVAMTASPNPARANEDIRFTITVTNHGPAAVANPTVVTTLPTSIVAVPTFTGGVCQINPASSALVFTCTLPSLAPGQSTPLEFTARLATAGVLNTGASVPTIPNDPDHSNNVVSLTVPVAAQSTAPSMTVPNLGVRTVAAGLDQPTGIAFVGADDFLALEKATGRVRRVRAGRLEGAAALDLAVNSASERGLLGIALHPDFAANGFVYLFWTESSTGADTTAIDEVALLGNRVDRYVWDGAALTHDRNLLRLRARQTDAGQPARGNHDGGRLRFGPDGKLYVLVGDLGRRGLLQNITSGGPVPDDEFGGPEPDDAHLSGVVLRLGDDGSTPADNPFFDADAGLAGEAAANVKKIFAYGVRNGFGMDFDPVGGALWTQENGDDSFDEINRVTPGFNGGWIQLMGPSSRVAEFKAIESTQFNLSLQQNRWPPSNIADTPAEALARLYALPGSHYAEPEFSWKYAVAPSPVGFARGAGLGPQYAGDLFVGASRTTLLGGYLMRLDLSADRQSVATQDARLADKVADNADKFDLTESESLVVGRDFGITTDIQTAPQGGLYVVSLSNGAVYEVFARPTLFVADLVGAQELPPNDSPARGVATVVLSEDETSALVSLRFRDLSAPQTVAHIHGPAPGGQSAPPVFDLPPGNFTDFRIELTPQQVSDLKALRYYVNVHSTAFPAGEIRGQLGVSSADSVVLAGARDVSVGEGARSVNVTFHRIGITSVPSALDYSTADGTASDRGDYTTAGGTLRFAPGETARGVDLLITDDAFVEGDEYFDVTLNSTAGGDTLALDPGVRVTIVDNDAAAPPTPNPIDDTRFFVLQHYHDFLGREPDQAGLDFWVGQIDECATQACREVRRVNVSAAFFLSIEFQETGYLVYRVTEASFDRRPRYRDFISDARAVGRGFVVGQGDWQARLAANRQSFADDWVARAAFRDIFDPLSNSQYVDRLFANAGVTPAAAERDALVAALDAGTKTRARVLLDVADNANFRAAEFNRAFVLMEYFGYLRRNPDDAPDFNLDGYNFWLGKLDEHGGNFVRAEMVRAFLESIEYRARFGQ